LSLLRTPEPSFLNLCRSCFHKFPQALAELSLGGSFALVFNVGTVVGAPIRLEECMRLRMGSGNRWVQAVVALAVVAVGALLLTVKSGAQDAGYLIVRATYGWRDQAVDVTDLVRDQVARGGRLVVNNQSMGVDPAKGQDKTLRIIGRRPDGPEREFAYREGDAVDLNVFVLPRRDDFDDRPRGDVRGDDRPRGGEDRQGLFIIRAYWGVQGRSQNVTDLVRSFQREGGLRMEVRNRALGGDPAPGADKLLVVIYRIGGVETFAVGREGDSIAIP
jgi:hypothetical protein